MIAFHESLIYPTDAAPGEHPRHVVATDPKGRFHKVHHQAGNPKGTYEDDSPEYWDELAEALSSAGAILLLGHGKGKANASHHWVAYVEKHRKDVAAKIVADVRVDIDHLTDEQVLRPRPALLRRPPSLGSRRRLIAKGGRGQPPPAPSTTPRRAGGQLADVLGISAPLAATIGL